MSKIFAGTVFFDGACPLCQRSRKIISNLDWCSLIKFVDFRQLTPTVLPPGLDLKNLEGEMHLVTPKGKVLKGFDSFRWMAFRLPATFWMAPFLHLPGIPFMGRKIYRYIARNRLSLIKVKGPDKCPLHGCGPSP